MLEEVIGHPNHDWIPRVINGVFDGVEWRPLEMAQNKWVSLGL